MSRPKEYHERQVLDIAMGLFWNEGYAATSIGALTKEMQINKFTLYDVFGSKEGLLVHTMQHYMAIYCDPILSILNNSEASVEALILFFEKYLTHAQEYRNGCYILSVTTETGSSIEPVRLILKEYLDEIEIVLFKINDRLNLRISQEDQDIKARQTYNLFLSLMLVSSVHSFEYCMNFMRKSLSLICS